MKLIIVLIVLLIIILMKSFPLLTFSCIMRIIISIIINNLN